MIRPTVATGAFNPQYGCTHIPQQHRRMWAGADAGNLHNGYTRQWTVHYGPTLIAHCWPQSCTNDFDSARITLWRLSPAPRNRQRRESYLHAPAKAEYPIRSAEQTSELQSLMRIS